MKYFTNVNTLDELKAEYRRLAQKHHPDHGGSVEVMQEINNEHGVLHLRVLRGDFLRFADEVLRLDALC